METANLPDTTIAELEPDNPDNRPEAQRKRRTRATRPFPAAPFEEALDFAQELFKVGSGQPVRRLTLFDHWEKHLKVGPAEHWLPMRAVMG